MLYPTVTPAHSSRIEADWEPKNDRQAHDILLDAATIAHEREVYDQDPTGGSSSPYGF